MITLDYVVKRMREEKISEDVIYYLKSIVKLYPDLSIDDLSTYLLQIDCILRGQPGKLIRRNPQTALMNVIQQLNQYAMYITRSSSEQDRIERMDLSLQKLVEKMQQYNIDDRLINRFLVIAQKSHVLQASEWLLHLKQIKYKLEFAPDDERRDVHLKALLDIIHDQIIHHGGTIERIEPNPTDIEKGDKDMYKITIRMLTGTASISEANDQTVEKIKNWIKKIDDSEVFEIEDGPNGTILLVRSHVEMIKIEEIKALNGSEWLG